MAEASSTQASRRNGWRSRRASSSSVAAAFLPAGAIVIVRDPRDVAPSLANHRRTSVDEAIAFMADKDACFSNGGKGQAAQLRQRLLDWSGHVASWLDQPDIPVHLVRYEDLHGDPVAAFSAAMAFAGRTSALDVIARAVEYSRFERLQAQERDQGFVEWRARNNASALFFRRGQSQAWRSELSAEQIRRIESVHGPMMGRLGYLLAEETDSVLRPDPGSRQASA